MSYESKIILYVIIEDICKEKIQKLVRNYPLAQIHVTTLLGETSLDSIELELNIIKHPFVEIYKYVDEQKITNESTRLLAKFQEILDGIKVKVDETFDFSSLSKVMANTSSDLLSRVIRSMFLLRYLVEKLQPNLVLYDGVSACRIPDRPDVKRLYFNRLILSQSCKNLLDKMKVKSVCFSRPSVPFLFLTVVRDFLIFAYKLKTILLRVYYSPKIQSNFLSKLDKREKIIIIVIRAQSEWHTIRAFYKELLAHNEYHPILIQDDLIKHPSGLDALIHDKIDFVPIHANRTVLEIFKDLLLAKWNISCAIRKMRRIISNQQDTIENFLTSTVFESVAGALSSYPELKVYFHELSDWMHYFSATSIIHMDMIDKWGSFAYEAAKKESIKCIILQNANLMHIAYPNPVSANVMWLSNKDDYQYWLGCNIPQSSSVAFVGSPFYSELYQRSMLREQQKIDSNQILIATQPYPADIAYNYKMLTDVAKVAVQIDATILVKLHPRECLEDYVEFVKQLPGKVTLTFGGDIVDLMLTSWLFIAQNSTTLQTAVLIGVPAISYLNAQYVRELTSMITWIQDDAIVKINNDQTLLEYLLRFKKNQKINLLEFKERRQKYIEKFIGYYDNDFSKRMLTSLNKSVKLTA